MKAPKFDRIVEKRFDSCKSILLSKADEYASGTDRLHNFIRAGAARGRDPVVVALDGMMMKHLVSVWDIIDIMGDHPDYVPCRDVVAEKIGDCINYLLLLEGLIEDRRSKVDPEDIE